MNYKQVNKVLLSVLLIAALVILILIGGLFILQTAQDVKMQNQQYLSEIARQNASLIKNTVEIELDKLDAIARVIGDKEPFSQQYAMEVIESAWSQSKYKRMGFVNQDGSVDTTDQVRLNVLDRPYYLKALGGERNVSDRLEDKVGGGYINVYVVPVYQKETFIGAIIATNDADTFSGLLSVDTFYGEGFSYIIKEDGSNVACTAHNGTKQDHRNLFGIMRDGGVPESSIIKMRTDMQQGKTGIIEYNHGGIPSMGAYRQVGINDWYVVSVVPKHIISKNTDRLIFRNIVSVVLTVLVFCILLFFMVMQNQKNRQKLERLAFCDSLTGGNNLNKLKKLAQPVLSKNKGDLYMVRIDIDNFKLINDMYGNEEGDEVLLEMDRLISEILTKEDIYGRVDSDNFLCLLRHSSDEAVIGLGTRFRNEFKDLLHTKEKGYTLNFTTGVYKIPVAEMDMDKIIDRTTMAHRKAKLQTSERKFAFYSEETWEEAVKRKNIENTMHEALANGEFIVYLQPKYDVSSGKLEGAEALVRWCKGGKTVSPSEFVPVFEKNGFIVDIDLFVLEEVCKLQRKWLDAGFKPVPISVNQSKPLVYGTSYAEKLYSIINRYALPPYLVELELLETLIHDNIAELIKITAELRQQGFLICIDDFGSGYSSLNMLKDLQADVLKIDREFLTTAENNKRAEFVLRSIINMAKGLGMVVVTEGVETQNQADLLKQLGCHMAQGYLYAKPMSAEDFEGLIIGV